jgi:hypothetical protein
MLALIATNTYRDSHGKIRIKKAPEIEKLLEVRNRLIEADLGDAIATEHWDKWPGLVQAGFVKAESLQTRLPNYQDSYLETTM